VFTLSSLYKLVKGYNKNGFKAITRQNLYYRLSKLKAPDSDNNMLGQRIVTNGESKAVLSDTTDEQILLDITSDIDTNSTNIGNRKKGSTKEASRENFVSKKNYHTMCYDK
jgi:hypothetical protein